jgi:general nucleoside transport system permease protein
VTGEGSTAQVGMSLDASTLVGGNRRSLLLTTALAIVLGLLSGAILIVFSDLMRGNSLNLMLPIEAYAALLNGSLGSIQAIGATLNSATPLIFTGLAVAFGFRAGLFNIGANGQFLFGAFFAAVVGSMPIAPFPIHAFLALAAGFLGGFLWGFIPGILKAWRGAHEVVTTIMLNFIAFSFLALMASTWFKDPGASFPKTRDTLASAVLPVIITDSRLHAGILLALLTALVVWFVLFKTTLGFEIRTVGINPFAARYAGIRPGFITILTMSVSGALAGLGGAVQTLGVQRNYPAEYLINLGFDGIAVALVGRAHPLGVIGAALLFGALRAGAGSMQRATGIPTDIIAILQAFIILFVAADAVLRRAIPWLRQRRAPLAPAAAA